VTFEDDNKGKVLGTDVIKVNDCFTLNDVALVDRLRYNLLSVSQLCDADLSVLFRKSDSHVLDSFGKRVCGISHIGNVFQADFSSAQSSLRCLISQSSSELRKWHRRLGHLSFDLLCRLSGLGLLRGLPLLKFESDLICAPCRHGKMIAASHSPINTVMTEHPGQLLHMDTIGPSRVRSMGGKWYALVIVDDYSRYSWVFFLESKDQVFEHFSALGFEVEQSALPHAHNIPIRFFGESFCRQCSHSQRRPPSFLDSVLITVSIFLSRSCVWIVAGRNRYSCILIHTFIKF
jgi:hypothetical protein